MINLMYLVLTALLALNVSNEILNAFRTLSSSIDRSNTSIDQKNKDVYDAIKANELAPGQAAKVKPFRIKADEVVKQADDMVNYLNEWKRRIVIESGGYAKYKDDSEDTHFPDRMDNIDATTSLLVEKKGGDTIKKRIEDLRTFMLSQVFEADKAAINPLMPLKVVPAKKNDHNPTGDWNIGNFEHMPAIAALALFSKYQNDVRASEALVINKLFEEAHGKDIKFDTIAAVAVPKNSYVLDGDKVEASILLAAFNREQKPTIAGMTGGGSTKPAVAGVIPWETIAHGTGLQTVNGTIELNTAEQGLVKRQFKFEYMVGTTGASMQLDKMNVFYIGVPNPVTVTAAGYSVEDVSLDIPGAKSVSGEKGHYSIEVDKIGKVQVGIMAKTKEGSKKKVGEMEVRVKRIPDPVAKVGGKISGSFSAPTFKVQIAPAATLDYFDFDAKFKITHFEFAVLPKGGDYQGPISVDSKTGTRFTDNQNVMQMMSRLKAQDRVFIDNIKAVGPDGTVRNIGSLTYLMTN
jgi:gliding motility-associated protein GldM